MRNFKSKISLIIALLVLASFVFIQPVSAQLCSTIYDPVCGTDGKTYSNDCYAKQANVGIVCEGSCPCKCPDGTAYGKCSLTKPLFCEKGELINKCSECGCPSGQECQTDGSCKKCITDKDCTNLICPMVVGGNKPKCDLKTGTCYCGGVCGDGYCDPVEKRDGSCAEDCNKCSDGTPYGECSVTKPLYCDNGQLVNKCSVCGCQEGEECQSDESCKAMEVCGNCICEEGETESTCRKDCDFSIVTFSSQVTEDRAREIISACNGLMYSWFGSINGAAAKVNRCTARQFKSCVEAYPNEVTGVTLSKYYDNAIVVLQYGLGERYNNPGKCDIKGWQKDIIYQTEENSCVPQGQVKLPDHTLCFYWSYSEGSAFFYIAKVADVTQNFVNSGDALELVTTIPIGPKDSLPMTSGISDVCLDPFSITDEEVQREIDYVISKAFPECGVNSSLTEADVQRTKGGKKCLDGSTPYCVSKNECYCISGKFVEAEISTPSGLKTVSIEKVSENTVSIKTGNVSAITTQKITIEGDKLYMETSAGKKQIMVLPGEAVSKATEIGTVIKTVLIEENGKPIYSIRGTKEARILFIIPVSMEIETNVDAESGEVISVNKPWWSLFAW